MVMIKDVSWGSYGGYEGSYFAGSQKVSLPEDPTFDEKLLYVISSAEGKYDSINMYDRAICSVGAIQWIELGQYSVSDMIGYVAETCGIDLVEEKLRPALTMAKATFKKTEKGKWRFHIPHPKTNEEVPVETEALSRWMFARGSSKIGSWTDVNKIWNRCWAAAIASLFQDSRAIAAQVKWTAPQLLSRFVLVNGKKHLFPAGSSFDGFPGALKALHISYGVNLPAVAEKISNSAVARTKFPKWSKQWCLDIIHDLVLTSGVGIWPGRYNSKRPALEKAFGIELPKTHTDLAKRLWTKEPIELLLGVETPKLPPVDSAVLPEEKPYNLVVHRAEEDKIERPAESETAPSLGFFGFLVMLLKTFLGLFRK